MGPPSNDERIFGYVDLFKKVGDPRPAHIYSLCTKEIKIGREHKCDIRIHNLRISRLQCCINVSGPEDNQKVRLQNLTAKATTIYKNRAIQQDEQVELGDGDRFRLYDTELRFRHYREDDPQLLSLTGKAIPIIRLSGKEKNGTPSSPVANKVSSVVKSPKTEKIKSNSSSKSGDHRLNKSLGSSPGGSGRGELDRTPKRRKSSDMDMRKAVLQRRFRKSVQGKIFPDEILERPEAAEDEEDGEEEEEEEEPAKEEETANESRSRESTFVNDSFSEAGPEIKEKAAYIVPEEESLDLISPIVEQPVNGGQQNNLSEDLIEFEDIEKEMFQLHEGDQQAAGAKNDQPSVTVSAEVDAAAQTADVINNNSAAPASNEADTQESNFNSEPLTETEKNTEILNNIPDYDSFSSRWDDSMTTFGKSFHTATSGDDEQNLSFEPMEVDEGPFGSANQSSSTFYDAGTADITADMFQDSFVGANTPAEAVAEVTTVPATQEEQGPAVSDEIPASSQEVAKNKPEHDKSRCNGVPSAEEIQSSSNANTTEDVFSITACVDDVEAGLEALFHSEVEVPSSNDTVKSAAVEEEEISDNPVVQEEHTVNTEISQPSETTTKPDDAEQGDEGNISVEPKSPVVDLQEDSNDVGGGLPDVVPSENAVQIEEVTKSDGAPLGDRQQEDQEEDGGAKRDDDMVNDDEEGSVVSASDIESELNIPAHVSSVDIVEMETQVIVMEENVPEPEEQHESDQAAEDSSSEAPSQTLGKEAASPTKSPRASTRSLRSAGAPEALSTPAPPSNTARERDLESTLHKDQSPTRSPHKQSNVPEDSVASPQVSLQKSVSTQKQTVSVAATAEVVPENSSSIMETSPSATDDIPVITTIKTRSSRRATATSAAKPKVHEVIDVDVDEPEVERETAHSAPSGEEQSVTQQTSEIELDLSEASDEGFMLHSYTTPRRNTRRVLESEGAGHTRNATSTPRTRQTRAALRSQSGTVTRSSRITRSSDSDDVEILEPAQEPASEKSLGKTKQSSRSTSELADEPSASKKTSDTEETVDVSASAAGSHSDIGQESPSRAEGSAACAPELEELEEGSQPEAKTDEAELSFPTTDSDVEADLLSVADLDVQKSSEEQEDELTQQLSEVIPVVEDRKADSQDRTAEEKEMNEQDERDNVDNADDIGQEEEVVHPPKDKPVLKEFSIVLKRLVMDFGASSSEEEEEDEDEDEEVEEEAEVHSEKESGKCTEVAEQETQQISETVVEDESVEPMEVDELPSNKSTNTCIPGETLTPQEHQETPQQVVTSGSKSTSSEKLVAAHASIEDATTPKSSRRRSARTEPEGTPAVADKTPVQEELDKTEGSIKRSRRRSDRTESEGTSAFADKSRVQEELEKSVDRTRRSRRRSLAESSNTTPVSSKTPSTEKEPDTHDLPLSSNEGSETPDSPVPSSSEKRKSFEKEKDSHASSANLKRRSTGKSPGAAGSKSPAGESLPSSDESDEISSPKKFKMEQGVRYDASIQLCNVSVVLRRLEDEDRPSGSRRSQRVSARDANAVEEDVEYVDLESDSEVSSSSGVARLNSSRASRRSRSSMVSSAEDKLNAVPAPPKISRRNSTESSSTDLVSTSEFSSVSRRMSPPVNAESDSEESSDDNKERNKESAVAKEDDVSDAETVPISRTPRVRAIPVSTPRSAPRRGGRPRLPEVVEIYRDKNQSEEESEPMADDSPRKKQRKEKKTGANMPTTSRRGGRKELKTEVVAKEEPPAEEVTQEEEEIFKEPSPSKPSPRKKTRKQEDSDDTQEAPKHEEEVVNTRHKERRAPQSKQTEAKETHVPKRKRRGNEPEVSEQPEPARAEEQEVPALTRRGRREEKVQPLSEVKKKSPVKPLSPAKEAKVAEPESKTTTSKSRPKRGAKAAEVDHDEDDSEKETEKPEEAKSRRGKKTQKGKAVANPESEHEDVEEPTGRSKPRKARGKKDSDESSQERSSNVSSLSSESEGRTLRRKAVEVVTLDEDPGRRNEMSRKKGGKLDKPSAVADSKDKDEPSAAPVASSSKSRLPKPVIELTRVNIPSRSPRVTRSQSTEEEAAELPPTLPPPSRKRKKGEKKVEEQQKDKDEEEPPSDTESVSSRTHGRKVKEPHGRRKKGEKKVEEEQKDNDEEEPPSDTESVSSRTRGRKVKEPQGKSKKDVPSSSKDSEAKSSKKTKDAPTEEPTKSTRSNRRKQNPVEEEEVIEINIQHAEKGKKQAGKAKKNRAEIVLTESEEEEEDEVVEEPTRRGGRGKKPEVPSKTSKDDEPKAKRGRRADPVVPPPEEPKVRRGRGKAAVPVEATSSKAAAEDEIVELDDEEAIENDKQSQKGKKGARATAASSKKPTRTQIQEDPVILVAPETSTKTRRGQPVQAVQQVDAGSSKREKRTKTHQTNAKASPNRVVLQLPQTNDDDVIEVSSDEEERPKPRAKRARTDKEPAVKSPQPPRTRRKRKK